MEEKKKNERYNYLISNGCVPTGYNETTGNYIFNETTANMLLDKIKQLEQSQKQLAIKELEKVKEKLVEDRNNAQVLLDPIEQEDYHELIGVIRGYRNSIYEVQKQIKSLRGEE